MKSYRIAIAGAGPLEAEHRAALRAHPRFDVAEAALAQPGDVAAAAAALDAIAVVFPQPQHDRALDAAIEAGLAVLCEAPPSPAADCARIAAAAASAGIVCGVARRLRFLPAVHALHELVENRHLDPLHELELADLRSDASDPLASERAFCALADLAVWLGGGAAQTRATGMRAGRDGLFALLALDERCVARVSADRGLAIDGFTCAIHGGTRTAIASGTNPLALTLFSIDAEETNELDCKPSPWAHTAAAHPDLPLLLEAYDEFARALDGEPNALPAYAGAADVARALAATAP